MGAGDELDPLAHPVRKTLHLLVRRVHQITLTDAALRCGVAKNSLLRHARILHSRNLLYVTKKNHRIYLQSSPGKGRSIDSLSATASEIALEVLSRPGCTPKDLSRRLGFSLRLVRYHLAVLTRRGYLSCAKGRPSVLTATDELVAACARIEE